ncbi:ParB/RepB/Spo0J family partition protein [Planctomicrobium sp. SH527]|uniref:ParB/RepB/Spo0J family partition protein n=1 Tax=Planctomicrobium sp. SH527 TaxID=3448123 RepID=UPI003F5CA87C
MNVHPYLAIFPLMTTDGLRSLAEDIKANGLQLPILIDDQDRIIDGRNRLAACQMAGVEPIFEPVTGSFQVQRARIISLNKERRHMTEAQWGMTAAKLANMTHGGDRKQDLTKDQEAPVPLDLEVEPISLSDAAKEVGVSRRTAVSCKKILREGVPELVKAVEAGEIKAKPAERIASLPKKEQPQAIQNHVNRVSAPVLEQEKPEPLLSEEPEVKRSPLQELVSRRLEKENPIQVAHDAIGLLKTISREHPLHREAWVIVRNFINCNLDKGKS